MSTFDFDLFLVLAEWQIPLPVGTILDLPINYISQVDLFDVHVNFLFSVLICE